MRQYKFETEDGIEKYAVCNKAGAIKIGMRMSKKYKTTIRITTHSGKQYFVANY